MTSFNTTRMSSLAEQIEGRAAPLGVGLKNQCFAGLAAEIARDAGETVLAHFGGSSAEWKAAIRMNNATPVAQRNDMMARHARDLAAS